MPYINLITWGLIFASSVAWAEELAEPESSGADAHRNIVYKRIGDRTLRGDLYVPRDVERAPAVLLLHGGAWKHGSKSQMAWQARRLARSGFVTFAVNYRLAPEHPFPAQIEDAKSAVRFLRDRSDTYSIDPNRIAAYGYSAGAQLACLLGTTDEGHGLEGGDLLPDSPSSRVQAVVAGGAPCDFRILPSDSRMLAYWLGGTRIESPRQYVLASPLAALSADDPPMFFFHGDDDALVPSLTARRMFDRLRELGIASDFYLCPNKGHVRSAVDLVALGKSIDFLREVLITTPSSPANNRSPGNLAK